MLLLWNAASVRLYSICIQFVACLWTARSLFVNLLRINRDTTGRAAPEKTQTRFRRLNAIHIC